MEPLASGRNPVILGLTGPIACGKTTAGNFLLQLGARERIDADELVHELMRPGTKTTATIAEQFGADVLMPDGSVDRKRLGQTVFGNLEALRRLEAIVHPGVSELVRERLQQLAGGGGVVIIDAIKLLQSELAELCDEIWVVSCPREVQRNRLRELRSLSEASIEARLDVQPRFKDERVRRVIENSGSLEEFHERLREGWESLQSERSR